jgi:membrane protein DedA with SNARE-associated domain
METFSYDLLPRLESLGSVVYWIIFLIGILESLPFVGLFIPGSVILTGMGLFASEGTFHVVDLIWVSAFGVIIGDCIGYHIGKHKGRKFMESKSHFINPKHINKIDAYFISHGGKSVFFGRFIGFLRPFTAFVAGMHHMKYSRFLLYTITSSILWSAIYILLGFYFGEQAKSFFLSHNRSWLLFIVVILLLGIVLFKWRKLKKSKIIN